MLLKADSVTLVLKSEADRKIRVTSTSWTDPIVILPGQALEVTQDGVALAIKRKLAPGAEDEAISVPQLQQA